MGTDPEMGHREASCPLNFLWKLGRVGPALRVEFPSEEQALGGVERVSWHGRERGKVQFGTG